MSSLSQLEQDLSYVDIGQAEGAVLVAGGQRVTCGTEGFYMAPVQGSKPYTAFVSSEMVRWTKVIQTAGIKPQ